MIDFTSFVDSVADLPAGSLAHAKRRVVAYHDSCQGSTHSEFMRPETNSR